MLSLKKGENKKCKAINAQKIDKEGIYVDKGGNGKDSRDAPFLYHVQHNVNKFQKGLSTTSKTITTMTMAGTSLKILKKRSDFTFSSRSNALRYFDIMP